MAAKVYEQGIVPCVKCRKPHDLREDPKDKRYLSWKDPDDGHAYHPMSAEQVMREFVQPTR